jgi:hypothetical protein
VKTHSTATFVVENAQAIPQFITTKTISPEYDDDGLKDDEAITSKTFHSPTTAFVAPDKPTTAYVRLKPTTTDVVDLDQLDE